MAIDDYQTDANGIITSPGRFQGEPHYVAVFYEYMLEGGEDYVLDVFNCNQISVFNITPEDLTSVPSLPPRAKVLYLWSDTQGFIHHELVVEYESGPQEAGGPAEGVPGVEVPQ